MDDETPLNSRGTPRTRFDPLRDAPRAKKADLAGVELEFGELGDEVPENDVLDPVSAVRRRIVELGLENSIEGAQALDLAAKAVDSVGSAAAACHHELRMLMDAIRTSKPAETSGDPTEDVLSRRRKAKGA
jgi:hypothetical protein